MGDHAYAARALAEIFLAVFFEDCETFKAIKMQHVKAPNWHDHLIHLGEGDQRMRLYNTAGIRSLTPSEDYVTYPCRIRVFAACLGGNVSDIQRFLELGPQTYYYTLRCNSYSRQGAYREVARRYGSQLFQNGSWSRSGLPRPGPPQERDEPVVRPPWDVVQQEIQRHWPNSVVEIDRFYVRQMFPPLQP